MIRQYRIRDYDFKLIVYVVALTIIGIFAIGSAKESVQSTQMLGAIGGFFIMVVISLFDYNVILKLYWIIYIGNLVLLFLVQSPFGKNAGGATRWLSLFGIRFQPSELAKILLILFFAQFIMINRERLNTFKFIIVCVALIGAPLYLIYNQPDMSTSVVVAVIFCVIMYMGGLSYKIILGIFAVMIPAFIIFLSIVLQPDQTLIEDYQQKRILAWLNPTSTEYANDEAYQQNNSVMAIGSGQLLGKGYNSNEISSVKNGNFISEPQTDFIFAVIGEEWGFVGGAAVIILIFLIAIECALIAKKANDLSGTIVAGGVSALIGFQGFVNISVATQVLPNTGLPLPFVSYGLSSLLSLYIGIGFVLNVRLQSKKY